MLRYLCFLFHGHGIDKPAERIAEEDVVLPQIALRKHGLAAFA